MFDPKALAVQYYFGDLGYWQLPAICIEALEHGFDGKTLRTMAGLTNLVASDLRPDQIDSAFREMGVAAPISKDEARLALAVLAVKRALSDESNVFNEATHIRIHLCNFSEVPNRLKNIVALSEESEHAPQWKWGHLEKKLRSGMFEFLNAQK